MEIERVLEAWFGLYLLAGRRLLNALQELLIVIRRVHESLSWHFALSGVLVDFLDAAGRQRVFV